MASKANIIRFHFIASQSHDSSLFFFSSFQITLFIIKKIFFKFIYLLIKYLASMIFLWQSIFLQIIFGFNDLQ